jgi:hypothetical protein
MLEHAIGFFHFGDNSKLKKVINPARRTEKRLFHGWVLPIQPKI